MPCECNSIKSIMNLIGCVYCLIGDRSEFQRNELIEEKDEIFCCKFGKESSYDGCCIKIFKLLLADSVNVIFADPPWFVSNESQNLTVQQFRQRRYISFYLSARCCFGS